MRGAARVRRNDGAGSRPAGVGAARLIGPVPPGGGVRPGRPSPAGALPRAGRAGRGTIGA
ncbi:hypothetical protein GCM10011594_27260 [Nakamurella endophytica]|uniref:Uncharacterized protein n=1 Tax=Nakamurella endophytica TaxID=1748367 RepID=A0A917T028_9ACTN|nr:hypothetical protein GCM10011594_27260 [Nakamurella endophytica]